MYDEHKIKDRGEIKDAHLDRRGNQQTEVRIEERRTKQGPDTSAYWPWRHGGRTMGAFGLAVWWWNGHTEAATVSALRGYLRARWLVRAEKHPWGGK